MSGAHVDVEPRMGAVGVDGVTKEPYGQDLEANLQDLHARLKEKPTGACPRHGAQPRRVHRVRPLWRLPAGWRSRGPTGSTGWQVASTSDPSNACFDP